MIRCYTCLAHGGLIFNTIKKVGDFHIFYVKFTNIKILHQQVFLRLKSMDFLLDTLWVLCYSSQRWSTVAVQFVKVFEYLPI
jgi:hypothetical protein